MRGFFLCQSGLGHVWRDELRHLKHGYFCFTTEERLKLVIREDVALVSWVLEVILLNVLPDLLSDLRAGHGAGPDNCLKFRREGHGLRKCRVRHSMFRIVD